MPFELRLILAGRDFLTRGLSDSMFFLYYLLRFPFWLKRRLGRSLNQDDPLQTGRHHD